jgi:hypothetical protein
VPRSWNGAPQEVLGELDLAGADQRPDVRGGDDLVLGLDQRHHPGLEPRVGRQQLRDAGRTVAEAEVLPDRDMLGAQALDQHMVDELLRGLLGEALVERDHHQLRDPQAGHQLGLDVEAGQELGGPLGVGHRERVRLERQHGVGTGDHRPVAEVHAVELADRDPAGARLDIGEHRDLHRAVG